ncbi:MAG: HD domain-containing protein [Planctomycetes bacterium]|nr:HD domain-containing protein [Planctomycetota bacterium]
MNPRKNIDTFAEGDALIETYLVQSFALRMARSGTMFLAFDLADATGRVKAYLWEVEPEDENAVKPGDFVEVRAVVEPYGGALTLRVIDYKVVVIEKVDRFDFLPHTKEDIDAGFARTKEILESIETPPLKELAAAFLADEILMRDFKLAPASIYRHHAYLGGLLIHTLRSLELAVRLCEVYPAVRRDVVLLGVFLHDLGKTREYRYDNLLDVTDEGKLVGHVVMSLELLTEKLAALDGFPDGLSRELRHLVLAHHGSRRWGSPVPPMTLEAFVVHQLEFLDAKIDEWNKHIGDADESGWTKYLRFTHSQLWRGWREDDVPAEDGL